MPAERTPKVNGGTNRQKTPAKPRGNGGGSQARGGGAGKMAGSTRQRGAQRLKEYEFPAFSQAESMYFSSEASWQDLDAKLARTGLRRLGFGADFPISNNHLQVISDHPEFAVSLEMISLGDEDSGNGTMLTDVGILKLVSATPNLRVLQLSSCLNLTDATLVNVLTHCPRLESLRISAHDKGYGKITHKGLKSLRERPEIGSALKQLVLLSQSISDTTGEKEAKALTKAKKGLAVTIGDIPGRYDRDGDAPDPVYFNGKMHLFGTPV